MRGRTRRVCLAVLALTGSIQIDGCSSALRSIGDARPYDTHPRLPVDPWKMEEVGIGAPLRVQLRDGRSLNGRFGGFERTTDSLYLPRYDAWRPGAPGGSGIPLGARIQWTGIGSAPDSGTFAGYDVYSVRVVAADGVTRVLRMSKLDWIEANGGNPVGADSLIAWCQAGRIPLVTGLRLGTSQGMMHLELETVSEIRVTDHKAVIGVAVLAGMVAVVLVIAANQPHSPPTSGCSDPGMVNWFTLLGPEMPSNGSLAAH